VELPKWVPTDQREFLACALNVLAEDPRVVGVAAGGSFISKSMDEYSDIDLVIVVSDEALRSDTEARMEIARTLGPLLTGFRADHVGEPRLIICLYGPPIVKADLKFIVAEDLLQRVEDPVVLYDPQGVVEAQLRKCQAHYPSPDRQWIEDAFWIWIHYVAAKIRRDELFEAKAIVNFLMEKVLGPLATMEGGHRATGVRRIELRAPNRVLALSRLFVPFDRQAIKESAQAAVDLYISLRVDVEVRKNAEVAAVQYLADS